MLNSCSALSSSQMPFDWLKKAFYLWSFQTENGHCVTGCAVCIQLMWQGLGYGWYVDVCVSTHTLIHVNIFMFMYTCSHLYSSAYLSIRMHLYISGMHTYSLTISCPLGLSTVAPPIHQRPVVPTAVIPLPPGTHLLFAQTGKIERLPLEGNTMKKTEAKAFFHIPVSIGWLALMTVPALGTWLHS